MEKIVLSLILVISLWGEENFIDRTVKKAKEGMAKIVQKGESVLVDKTLTNSINAVLDKKHIEIKSLKKNLKTNALQMIVYLNGEKKYLSIILKDFEWGYSKDEESIIIQKIKLSTNIEYIEYLINDTLKRYHNVIVVPNYLSTASFLESIRPPKKINYIPKARAPFDFLRYKFDKRYFNVEDFVVKNKTLKAQMFAKGSDKIQFELGRYDLFTSNNRRFIVMKNISIKSTNKPWMASIIKTWNNSIRFDYEDNFYQVLAGKQPSPKMINKQIKNGEPKKKNIQKQKSNNK